MQSIIIIHSQRIQVNFQRYREHYLDFKNPTNRWYPLTKFFRYLTLMPQANVVKLLFKQARHRYVMALSSLPFIKCLHRASTNIEPSHHKQIRDRFNWFACPINNCAREREGRRELAARSAAAVKAHASDTLVIHTDTGHERCR